MFDRRVLGEAKAESGLPHGRPGRHDDEVGRLKSRRDVIEVGEPARNAGDALAALGERFDALHGRPQQLLDPGEIRPPPDLTELQDLVLRGIEQLGGRCVPLERLGDDPGRYLDESAQQRFLPHDAGVVFDIGGRRDRVDQERDVVAAAARLELAAPRELFGEGERVDDIPALGQREHPAEDPAVRFPIEHRVIDDLGRAHHGVRVHHHRRENSLFSILRVGRAAVAVRVAVRGRAGVRVRARCHRECDVRTGHLPKSDVSKPDSEGARPGGR